MTCEMNDDINKIKESLSNIDKTMAVNTLQLEIHLKRSEMLEKQVNQQQKFLNMALGAWVIIQVLLPYIMK